MAAVCVFTSSSEDIAAGYVSLAAEVGAALAARGHSLVSGAGSVSCMGAVARAVRRGGGRTVGVIPEGLLPLGITDTGADELLVVPDMRARKSLMDARSDAFLALPGGLGTLEELLEAWVAGSLGLHDKPVVALDPDGLFAPLRDQVALLVDRGFARPEALACLVWTTDVPAALDALEAGLADRRTRRPRAGELVESDVSG